MIQNYVALDGGSGPHFNQSGITENRFGQLFRHLQEAGLGQFLQSQAGGSSVLRLALHQPLQITGYLIHLEIYPVTRFPAGYGGLLGGVRHYGEAKQVPLHGIDRQADAIYRDRPLLGDVARERPWCIR